MAVVWMGLNWGLAASALVCWRLWEKCFLTPNTSGVPDGSSVLMLVCARLRHVTGTQWGNRKYMNMKHLKIAAEDTSVAG